MTEDNNYYNYELAFPGGMTMRVTCWMPTNLNTEQSRALKKEVVKNITNFVAVQTAFIEELNA